MIPTPMQSAKPGERIVTVKVPKAFELRLTNHRSVSVAAGIQRMPLSLATHWYSVANKVQIISGSLKRKVSG